MTEPRLRVATINIWNRSEPWKERLRLLRAELVRLSPDVVGLQEVLRAVPPQDSPHASWTVPETATVDASADQATQIAVGLYRHVAYAAAMDFGRGLMFGNAVLSRYPIKEYQALALPGRELGEARVALYVRLDHPKGPLPVFVTHLNWRLHHGNIRLRQVEHIADRVRKLVPIDEGTLPPILMGDMNAEPDSDEMRYLRGLSTVDGRSVYFADAWLYGGDGTPGYTFDRRNRFAAIAHEPPRRIDYIFVRGPDATLRGEPLETRVVFATPEESPEGPIWPSDHFGVVTDLTIEERSLG